MEGVKGATAAIDTQEVYPVYKKFLNATTIHPSESPANLE